jgi:hypothetical protein
MCISGVLHQGVLEQVSRVRRHALAEQQPRCDQPVERVAQFRFRFAHDRCQQGMRKLPPDRGTNLRHALCRTEPVEPRHQRGVEAGRNR